MQYLISKQRLTCSSPYSGSGQLSRIENYYPDRLSALAFLTLGYSPPGADFTSAAIDASDEASRALFGYPLLQYWHFNADDRAPAIADQHVSQTSSNPPAPIRERKESSIQGGTSCSTYNEDKELTSALLS
jgi:hypothetical protein